MAVRATRVLLASLAFLLFGDTGIFAAGANSAPHVDTSGVNLQPPYPPTALQTLERGAVVLGVAVSAQGNVTRTLLVETSGFNDLDASAISTVLGWKFVPAVKDGAPVEGTTMVKLIFEPPAPTSSSAASAQPSPPPQSKPLFPTQITMSAADGKEQTNDYPVPCGRGAFEGDVTMKSDAKKGGEMAHFGVQLSAGNELVQFDMSNVGAPLIGAELIHVTNNEVVSGERYWGSGRMGAAIPISVSWAAGRITGNGGLVFGQHQVGLSKAPEKLEISTYSGDVAISNARLVCTP